MQKTKFTPAFKGEENQGLGVIYFNQFQPHFPGLLCGTSTFSLLWETLALGNEQMHFSEHLGDTHLVFALGSAGHF